MISFYGFQPHDFHTAVRGSHWRHRRALGGQLRLRLRRIFGHRYQTWGLPGANTLHIARRRVYQFPPVSGLPCLFASASPQHLRWGIQFPAQGASWEKFVRALQRPPLLTWCLHQFEAHGMILTDLADDRGGALGGCWRFENGELTWREACTIPRTALTAEIANRLTHITPEPHTVLTLHTATTPEDVIGWGADAVEYLLPGLSALVPLYEWWVQSTDAPSTDVVEDEGIDQT